MEHFEAFNTFSIDKNDESNLTKPDFEEKKMIILSATTNSLPPCNFERIKM